MNIHSPRPLGLAMLIMIVSACGTAVSWAAERGDIFRQTRSAAVLLVSADKHHRSLSFGTGFFISDRGHILTNAHVLDPEAKLLVYVPDQGVFPHAETLAVDQDADLAVLHLPEAGHRGLILSESWTEEGADALAVGFPRIIDTLQMGLTIHSTVKPVNVNGAVLGRSRIKGRVMPFLQASGVLHAGTSGGPLVDAESGEVLGMVVHSVPYIGRATDRNGSFVGSVMLRADMSYAIPSSFIREWLADQQIPVGHDGEEHDPAQIERTLPRFLKNPDVMAMSLFLTGHLVQTIGDTVNVDQDFRELAVNHYEQALELFPDRAVIARNLALAYESLERYREALAVYEGLIAQFPSDPYLLIQAAHTLTLLDDHEQAMEMYRTALNYESCSLNALNGLGNLYLGNQEYGLAVQTFRQAVACMPSSAYAAYYLGESISRSGQIEEARSVWKGSLERITIQTPEEKELVDLMRQRIVNSSDFSSPPLL